MAVLTAVSISVVGIVRDGTSLLVVIICLGVLAVCVGAVRENRQSGEFVAAANERSAYFKRKGDQVFVSVDWVHCSSVVVAAPVLDCTEWSIVLQFEDYAEARWEELHEAIYSKEVRHCVTLFPASRVRHYAAEFRGYADRANAAL